MGYYLRVLNTSADRISVNELQSVLDKQKLRATLTEEAGTADQWEQVILNHSDGQAIAAIERNTVEDGSLGAEELEEFADEIADCKPDSAVRWLLDYFSRVRCIHAFQVLSGAHHENGWEILAAIKDRIALLSPSILQADAEGFSNENGYHILWQFSDSVDGTWWMAVLRNGEWVHFEMDLGSRLHRDAFFRGDVPDGVTLA